MTMIIPQQVNTYEFIEQILVASFDEIEICYLNKMVTIYSLGSPAAGFLIRGFIEPGFFAELYSYLIIKKGFTWTQCDSAPSVKRLSKITTDVSSKKSFKIFISNKCEY
jgi:hypothetical protein